MRYLVLLLTAFTIFSCGGPRPLLKIHFASLNDTNEGRALPLHVVPVDNVLRVKLDSLSAEEWFVSDDSENLTGIQKRVLRGAQSEIVEMARRDKKNDFMVVVDFAELKGSDSQKLYIGDQYYRAKEIFVLVSRDSIRVISKKDFNFYMNR